MKSCKLYALCIFLVGLNLVLAIPFSSAYQIKYYGKEKVNISFIDKIPTKYFDGVRVIRIYDSNVYHKGRYFANGVIDIYCKEKYCFEDTLVHELTHHQQWIYGLKLNHNFTFMYAQEVILSEIN